MALKSVCLLGATGSIGSSTLDVIARHPDRYSVYAVTAQTSVDALLRICCECRPQYAVIGSGQDADRLQTGLKEAGLDTVALHGEVALEQVAAADEVDIVMAAIVGAAGLAPSLAAAQAGKTILLANKETLVSAGGLFMAAVEASGATLLPVDSEHNAIFQCLPPDFHKGLGAVGVNKILLTASGGPFRGTPLAQLHNVSPEQACAHPNWSMGRKISVDSASMMNKGLELIEACWLFGCGPAQVEIVIHRQSVIHSLVQYCDGSVLAQLGNPDMRTPIANALAWPERIDAGVADLDLTAIARLDFEAPDYERFPNLSLAESAAATGGYAPTYLNAANEIAVDGFLRGQIGFLEIGNINGAVLKSADRGEPESIEAVKMADQRGRALALEMIQALVV